MKTSEEKSVLARLLHRYTRTLRSDWLDTYDEYAGGYKRRVWMEPKGWIEHQHNSRELAMARRIFVLAAVAAALPVLPFVAAWNHMTHVARVPVVIIGLLLYMSVILYLRGFYQQLKRTVIWHFQASETNLWFPETIVEAIITSSRFRDGVGFLVICMAMNMYVMIPSALLLFGLAISQAPDLVMEIALFVLVALRTCFARDFSLLVNYASAEYAISRNLRATLAAKNVLAMCKALKDDCDQQVVARAKHLDLLKSTILLVAGTTGVALTLLLPWGLGCLATIALVWAISYKIIPMEVELAVAVAILQPLQSRRMES